MSQYLLALNAHEKIGSQTLKKALAPFASPEELWKCAELDLKKQLDERIANLVIEARNNFDPQTEVTKIQKLGIGYVTIFDKDYPPLLKEAHDAPVVLYVRGSLESLAKPSIAIVGSRKYSNYGKNSCLRLARDLAESGVIIVSGLALGIDTIAHQAAVESGTPTIGVLGCGLGQVYPSSNFLLAKKMIDCGGAIVSEFPPGTQPMKYNFPQRNRIIAGLSLGTLVIEAAEKSGALITAYGALEYNREVFAVPGNIDSVNSVGTNVLIQNGAKLVLKVKDILDELNIEAKTIEQKNRLLMPETNDEKKICEILNLGEKLVDDIINESGLNVVAVNTTLTMLEMKGLVLNLGGGRYKRKKL